jgi:hypothetical protein
MAQIPALPQNHVSRCKTAARPRFAQKFPNGTNGVNGALGGGLEIQHCRRMSGASAKKTVLNFGCRSSHELAIGPVNVRVMTRLRRRTDWFLHCPTLAVLLFFVTSLFTSAAGPALPPMPAAPGVKPQTTNSKPKVVKAQSPRAAQLAASLGTPMLIIAPPPVWLASCRFWIDGVNGAIGSTNDYEVLQFSSNLITWTNVAKYPMDTRRWTNGGQVTISNYPVPPGAGFFRLTLSLQ